MATNQLMHGLRRQYGKTLGLLHSASSDRVRLMGDLAHLAAVIRMFRPCEDVESIRAIRPHKDRGATFTRQWTRVALDVLREAGEPLETREIARRVALAEGVTDPRAMASIVCSLHQSLERRRGVGVVRLEGEPKRWVVG